MDMESGKKVPLPGKHSKTILCAAWTSKNNLVTASLDRTLIISNAAGDKIYETTVKGEPYMIRVYPASELGDSISVVVSKRTIFLFTEYSLDQPVELAMNLKYGNILEYFWHSADEIIVAFDSGYISLLSTNRKTMGQELFHGKIFKDSFVSLDISSPLGKVASCGDNSIKIHEISNINVKN
jgi:WD repeat-containing protein 19